MKAKIHVTLKQGILDPQGKAIEHALDSLGFKNAGNVRVGKYMEVDVDEKDKVKAEAEKILSNSSSTLTSTLACGVYTAFRSPMMIKAMTSP